MITVYLSLGSNLGDREAHIRTALEQLGPRRVSPLYETEPADYLDQPHFLNLVAELETALMPRQLLGHVQLIEREMGRRKGIPKGPRIIDIDVLLYGALVIRTPRLQVPHPRLHERRFVLAPLADLAPDLRHPVTQLTVREMLAGLPSTPAVRLWTPL